LPKQKGKHIGDRALLDDKIVVHIRFTQTELGIQQYRALGFRAGEAHSDRRSAAVAEPVLLPARRGYSEGTVADEPPQKNTEQPIHKCLHLVQGRCREVYRPTGPSNSLTQAFPAIASRNGLFGLPSLKQNHRGPAMQANMSYADMSPLTFGWFLG
jgi:hypothetical protein